MTVNKTKLLITTFFTIITYLPVNALITLFKLNNFELFLVRRKDAVIVRDSNDTPYFYIVKSVRLRIIFLKGG